MSLQPDTVKPYLFRSCWGWWLRLDSAGLNSLDLLGSFTCLGQSATMWLALKGFAQADFLVPRTPNPVPGMEPGPFVFPGIHTEFFWQKVVSQVRMNLGVCGVVVFILQCWGLNSVPLQGVTSSSFYFFWGLIVIKFSRLGSNTWLPPQSPEYKDYVCVATPSSWVLF